jgi:PAS domain S-box-containing protein
VPLEGEFEVMTPKGQVTVYYKDSPIVRGGAVVGVQSILLDITKRKQAEEALRHSEAKYRKLHESLIDSFVSVDRNGLLIEFNGAYREMLGYSDEELHRLTYQDLTPRKWQDAEARIVNDQILTRGYSDVYEKEYQRKDGTIFPVELRTVLIRDAAGQPIGMWAIIRDITKRKRAEQQLLDYQNRLRELAAKLTLAQERERRRIAVGVHDQIGQRLALVKLALQSWNASVSDPSTRRPSEEVCKEIDHVIEDAHSLTFELSNPVLYEAGFANAVESWLVQQIHGRHGLQYTFKADPGVAPMDKDTGIALFQIVREILANVVRHAKAKQVDVRIQKAGDRVQITVQDDGVGFEPSKIGMTDSRAGGYGLFSARERLEYMGGDLKIESAPGKGACISITVPMQSRQEPERKEASPRES